MRDFIAHPPTLGLLTSIALRMDHNFGNLDPAQQGLMLQDALRAWEEITGKHGGFYTPEAEDKYLEFIKDTADMRVQSVTKNINEILKKNNL